MNLFGNDNVVDNYVPAPTPERIQKHERVAILTDNKTEDLEFFYPFYRLTEAGYKVDVLTPKGESFEAKHGLGLKKTMKISEAAPANYVLLYIPGGKAPASLRKNDEALDFVRQYASTGGPIAAICHGPQVLASAGLLQGKRVAAWPEIKDEITAAGAAFVNEALVEDGQLITARKPGDLPRHLSGVMEALERRNIRASGLSSRPTAAA